MRRKIEARFFSNRGNSNHGNYGPTRRIGALTALAIALLFATPVFAQLGPPAGQSQGTQAVQLPLSGRSAQSSGTVKTSDQPAPSTTSSNGKGRTTRTGRASRTGESAGRGSDAGSGSRRLLSCRGNGNVDTWLLTSGGPIGMCSPAAVLRRLGGRLGRRVEGHVGVAEILQAPLGEKPGVGTVRDEGLEARCERGGQP